MTHHPTNGRHRDRCNPRQSPLSCLHLPAKSKAANPSWGPGPRAVMPDALLETVEMPHESGPEALSGPPHLHTTPVKPPEPGCMSLGRGHYRGADKDSELGAQSATCVSLPPALGAGQCQRPEVRGTGPAGATATPRPSLLHRGIRAERPHETKPDLTLRHIPPNLGAGSGRLMAGPSAGTAQGRLELGLRRRRAAPLRIWATTQQLPCQEAEGAPEMAPGHRTTSGLRKMGGSRAQRGRTPRTGGEGMQGKASHVPLT